MRLSADHLLCSRNRKPRRYQAEHVWEDAGFLPRPCPVFDEVRGRVVEMYGSLKPGFSPSKEIEAKGDRRDRDRHRQDRVAEEHLDRPRCAEVLSGKVMRRVIAATSNFSDIGDITKLANPEIVESIRHQVQSAKVERGEVPRELTEAEEEEIRSFAPRSRVGLGGRSRRAPGFRAARWDA